MDAREIKELDDRIRQRAHRLWLEEGRPEGRAKAHWDMAREQIAIEDGEAETLLPPDALETQPEPTQAWQNQGDVPGLTDQGEDTGGPTRDAIPAARRGDKRI